jgi:DNA-binding NarL/FixJ family response regulator
MTSVFITDDHAMIVEGLVSLLSKESQIKVIGTATNAEACINFFKTQQADILITDINMPNLSGIELCKILKPNYPSTHIIALSTFNEGSYITKMLESGASGYLLKNANKEEILEAIQTVSSGKQYFPFDVQKIYKATLEKMGQLPILTKREKEILKHVADGLTNPQIGNQLFISVDTVDTHRKNLHIKLNVKNTAQLIKAAIENNLLD